MTAMLGAFQNATFTLVNETYNSFSWQRLPSAEEELSSRVGSAAFTVLALVAACVCASGIKSGSSTPSRSPRRVASRSTPNRSPGKRNHTADSPFANVQRSPRNRSGKGTKLDFDPVSDDSSEDDVVHFD